MRRGFFLGFVVGGAIASLLGKTRQDHLSEVVHEAAEAAESTVNPVVNRVKHQIDDAKDAAREAQLAKESEMLRTYEELIHRPAKPQ